MVILVVFPDTRLLLRPIPVHSGCYTRNTICGLTLWITLALPHLIKIFGPGSTMEKNKKKKRSFCFILSLSKQEFIMDLPFALFCTPACSDTKNITWNSSYLWPEWHMAEEALPRRWSQPGPVSASISVTQINGWDSTVVHGSRKFPTSDDSATFRRSDKGNEKVKPKWLDTLGPTVCLIEAVQALWAQKRLSSEYLPQS